MFEPRGLETESQQEKRDHLIGKLFGCKAIIQSGIISDTEPSKECWTRVLDHVYGLARDIPWLREECGLIICEAIRAAIPEDWARETIQQLSSYQLANTPEGVAIWLTARQSSEDILPDNVWYKKDPLSKKERNRLARVLKEDFQSRVHSEAQEKVKSASISHSPTFAWDVVIGEVLRRDERSSKKHRDESKLDFPQFWLDTVDGEFAAPHPQRNLLT
jgi:DNA polymerase phi